MGVDCKIYLPPQVTVRDVAEVVGILVGCRAERLELGGATGGWAVRVPGAKTQTGHDLDFGSIVAESPTQGNIHFFVMFNGDHRGSVLLMARAYPTAIAIAKRLVEFFGGYADYNDCDDSEEDIRRPARFDASPSDGNEWDEFQQAMFDVTPITDEERAWANKYSTYDDR